MDRSNVQDWATALAYDYLLVLAVVALGPIIFELGLLFLQIA